MFLRGTPRRGAVRQEVRIALRPKNQGPQVVTHMPTWQAEEGQPFVLGDWAADLAATEGAGIDTLHVWAYH